MTKLKKARKRHTIKCKFSASSTAQFKSESDSSLELESLVSSQTSGPDSLLLDAWDAEELDRFERGVFCPQITEESVGDSSLGEMVFFDDSEWLLSSISLVYPGQYMWGRSLWRRSAVYPRF